MTTELNKEVPIELNQELNQELSKEVIEDGKTVTVFSRMIEEDLWELSIQGRNQQFTTWTEWFPTAEKAMSAGMAAILEEGIQAFYSDPELNFLK